MRRWLLSLLVITVIAIAGWLYVEHLEDVKAQKKKLWQRLSDRQFSNLAECLEARGISSIEWCRRIEEAVDKAVKQ